jgi:hypothetical protein
VPKDLAELHLQGRQTDHPNPRIGLEFDKNIHVAIRGEILSKNRAEQRQSPDSIRLAKVDNFLMRYVQVAFFQFISSARLKLTLSTVSWQKKDTLF